ncbi:MAG: hypothetical protein A2202_05755 [Bdellovibrionales bacterium RIFOXYA1_FULL_36_14]|nr:MAG: hypothetical protein A2202_05755 [Bdellovibrionales bacterium RIFOXYA1_FULL_36_14]
MYQKLSKLLRDISVENDEIYFLRKWLLIGLGLHVICAVFSTGFLHFDEQWQILEFLGAKLGKTTFDVLPWEYRFKMRSWTQPGLYYLLFKPFIYLGIDNPFTLATIARLFSSIIGWVSIILVSLAAFFLFDKKIERMWAIRLLCITYFIPFIHARPSSEALSSSFFLTGLSMLIIVNVLEKKRNEISPWWLLIIGFIMGLSFTFRYQMGFVILFTWIWYIIWGKSSVIKIALLALGVVVAVLLEIPVDRWGYGEWTVAAWNYLDQNIIQDKASNFPTAPWYYFITKSFTRVVLPISLLVVPAWLIFWFKRPKHPVTFGTLPLVLIHSIIAAKAFRYLIPIAPLTPIVLVEMNKILPAKYLQKGLWFLKLCLVVNCILLIGVLFRSAKSVVGMYEFVYDNKITLINYTEENPYTMLGLPLNFYKSKLLEMKYINNYENLENQKGWIFVSKGDRILAFLNQNQCVLKYSSYPQFTLKLNYFKWAERSRFWALFFCE